MEAELFDRLTKAVSRREALGLGAGLLSALGLGEAIATGNRCRPEGEPCKRGRQCASGRCEKKYCTECTCHGDVVKESGSAGICKRRCCDHQCEPKTCRDFPGKCGKQPDGCGGETDNCACPEGKFCKDKECNPCPSKEELCEGKCGKEVAGPCGKVVCDPCPKICYHSFSNNNCKDACTSAGPDAAGCGGSCEDICGPACPRGTENRQCPDGDFCRSECFTCKDHVATFIC